PLRCGFLPPLLVDRFLELLASLEADALAGLDVDRLSRRRVPALARAALGHREAAEAGHLRGLARLERLGDRREDRVEGFGGLSARQPVHGVRKTIDEVSLTSHLSSFSVSFPAESEPRDDKATTGTCQYDEWPRDAYLLAFARLDQHVDGKAVVVAGGQEAPEPQPRDGGARGRVEDVLQRRRREVRVGGEEARRHLLVLLLLERAGHRHQMAARGDPRRGGG